MFDSQYLFYATFCLILAFAVNGMVYSVGMAQNTPLGVSATGMKVSLMQPGARLHKGDEDKVLRIPSFLTGSDFLEVGLEGRDVRLSAGSSTDYYLFCLPGHAPANGVFVGKAKCLIRGSEVDVPIYRQRIAAQDSCIIQLSRGVLTLSSPVIRLNRPPVFLAANGGIFDVDTLKSGKLLFLKDKKTAVLSEVPLLVRNLVYLKSFADSLQVDSLRSFQPIDYFVISAVADRQEKAVGVLQTTAGAWYVYRFKHPGGGRWITLPEKWKHHSVIAAADILIDDCPPVAGTPLFQSINPHKLYMTDPAIEILEDGTYIAGCRSKFDGVNGVVRIAKSSDKGKSWEYLTELSDVGFFSFFHLDTTLYLLGTKGGFNSLIIRKSTDGGKHWTVPTDTLSGLLKHEKSYHSASVSTVIHNGRVWRAFEDNIPKGKRFFRAFVMSAPVGSDLLRADSWKYSAPLPFQSDWLGDSVEFKGWFEGNVVVTPEGRIGDLLRVETWQYNERAALIRYDGNMNPVFRPETDLIPFPGGEKKFTVRFDSLSNRYWSLSNMIFTEDHGKEHGGLLRNRLVLTCSKDLLHWRVKDTIFSHEDPHFHGYQYVDWRIDGDDIVMVSRTAAMSRQGLPTRQHDANYFTFYKINDFRKNMK